MFFSFVAWFLADVTYRSEVTVFLGRMTLSVTEAAFIGLPGLSLWLSNSRKTSRYAPWSTYFRSYHTVYIVPH